MIFLAALVQPIMSIAIDAARDTILRGVKAESKEALRREAFRSQLPAFKALIAEQVANAYAKQIKEKSEGYVKAIEGMNLEASVSEEDGDDFALLAQNALKKLEIYIESQSSQDGPIIAYLKKRYREEDVKIISGRLYAGHMIKRETEGVYSIYNKMAYAPLVDKNKPWLSSEKTSEGIGEIIAQRAAEIFAEEFNVDIGDDEIYRI